MSEQGGTDRQPGMSRRKFLQAISAFVISPLVADRSLGHARAEQPIGVMQRERVVEEPGNKELETFHPQTPLFFVAGSATAGEMAALYAGGQTTWSYQLSNSQKEAIQKGYYVLPMFRLGPLHWQEQRFQDPEVLKRAVIETLAATGEQHMYMVGNEINLNSGDSDGNRVEEINIFVDQYKQVTDAIKTADPQAKIIGPSIIGWNNTFQNGTGKEVFEKFFSSYQTRYGEAPPIDIFNIHLYNLDFNTWEKEMRGDKEVYVSPGDSIDNQVADLEGARDWLNIHGYQNISIAITELGQPNEPMIPGFWKSI